VVRFGVDKTGSMDGYFRITFDELFVTGQGKLIPIEFDFQGEFFVDYKIHFVFVLSSPKIDALQIFTVME
jgi:hypothetical protein